MDILCERVAGLDVHKHKGGGLCADCGGRQDDAGVPDLFDHDGAAYGAESVAGGKPVHAGGDATGVYWMPGFRILGEGPFELMVANAAHIKNVPGPRPT